MRTYHDRASYIIQAVAKRRQKVKELALQSKGSKCQICGYNKSARALSFHHLDPSQKDFGISEWGYTRSWEKVKLELAKCVLVCANCPSEIHAGLVNVSRFTQAQIV